MSWSSPCPARSTRCTGYSGEPTGSERGGSGLRRRRRDSYSRLAVADGLLAFTIIAVLAAGAGIADKLGDSLVLLAVATITGSIAIARAGRSSGERPPTRE